MATTGTLAVFGITGRTGRALALAGRERGWLVRGLVRPASASLADLAGAVTVAGEFSDAARVRETVAAAEAVVCVIGPRPPYAEVFCAAATTAIVAAMKRSPCRRLVLQTGAMIGPAPNRSWLFERMARSFAARQPEAAADRLAQEQVVMESDLAWTIVKPPRLTGGPMRSEVEAGPGLRVGLMSRISRSSLARFILDEIEAPRFERQRVFVKE